EPSQLEAAMRRHVESAADYKPSRIESPTRLSYWFPRIQAARLPAPETRLVELSLEELGQLPMLFDGEEPPCLTRVVGDIARAAVEVGGAPFFLRTDFTSGK